jgi:hypothetical protein
LVRIARRYNSGRRRQKLSDSTVPAGPHDGQDRIPLIPARQIASPSPGETVIAIPPEGQDAGRERVFIRIDIGADAWVGNFEIGLTNVSPIFPMPDGKHLFAGVEGAGYIIDLKSRMLVEQLGTEVVGVMRDARMTLFLVNHNDISLEAFGTSGRLWKTSDIGFGGFRHLVLTDDELLGEVRHLTITGWVGFAVNVATGEVRFRDGG